MLHTDSADEEETKRLLAQLHSDESKESQTPKEEKNKGKTWIEKDDDGTEWETNDLETPDSEW